MRIILPRIPVSVTTKQLSDFAGKVLNSKLSLPFTTKPSLGHCEILSVNDHHGIVEHHGLITINPESAAHWFVKKARGKMLGNKRVVLREYIDRKSDGNSFPAEDDRRNHLATTEKVHENTIKVEGLEQFRHEYH